MINEQVWLLVREFFKITNHRHLLSHIPVDSDNQTGFSYATINKSG
ncbi:hypothetical protein [Neobacillus piezotolerans]|nr:hypothetical protein [Neobacillus piezotolerans]